jgi:hypothetical protein
LVARFPDVLRVEKADEDENFIYGSTPLPKMEVIKETWKCYIPAAIMGGVTITCIICANSINLKRNAALAGLYSLSETTLKEYQTKVAETIGKNKEQKIKDEIDKDRIEANPVDENKVIITGKGDVLCYDAISGRYFKSDIEHIRKAINDIGVRMLHGDDFMSLNDVYSAIGLGDIGIGNDIGWAISDGVVEPRFSSQLADGIPCLVLDFIDRPSPICYE